MIKYLLFLFLPFACCLGQNTIVLNEANPVQIGKQILYLEDSEGALSLEDMLKPENQAKFIKSEKDVLNFGRSQSWYWVKFSLINRSEDDRWLLEITEPRIKFADLYFQDSAKQWQCSQNGYALLSAEKFKQHHHQVFPLPPLRSEAVLYLRTQGNLSSLPMRAVTEKWFETDNLHKNFAYGLNFGILLFVALNNLAFGLLSRKSIYLLYAALTLNYMAGPFFLHGYMDWFIDINPSLLKVVSLTSFSNLAFVFLYEKKFLNIPSYSWMGKTVNLFVWLCFISFTLVFLLSPSQAFILTQVFVPLSFVVILAAAVSSLKRERQFAVYYLIAFGLFAFFIVLELLRINTGKPGAFYLGHGSWGMLGEVIILAYALNRRFEFEQKNLEKAKETAQKEVLEHIKENARIVEVQNALLESKVKERTFELHQTNEELATTNEELQQTQEEISAQRDLLQTQNGLLGQYNHKISQSISAAKMIQKAILPPKNKMADLFGDHFVFFKPRDVVSGDFWWAEEINGQKFLIVADCTGHGVPGALLTMIGSSLLDKIIKMMNITDPAAMLENLNNEIVALLRQDETEGNEGMDIAIASWRYEGERCLICFGAAKRPLFYASGGQAIKLAGSRKDIGGNSGKGEPFETKTLELQKGDCLYLCSDGYQDQNNPKNHSFSGKRLLELFQEINPLPMEAQKEALAGQLAQHQAGMEQRDDILVIGVRL